METKDKVLNSALILFVENGFDATTSSITKRARVSSGILFHYFNTKTDLIIELYTKILSEYYSQAAQTLQDIPQNDLEKYQKIVRLSQEKMVYWGINNWQKFQYLQLFEGSLLANQFSLQENKEIEKMYLRFYEVTRLGIEYGYLKNLPVDYLTNIGVVMSSYDIKYFHENPKYWNDENFKEDLWQIQWNIIAK
ncbi:MAG: TetR/AcrR family transcriptional regulator [Anaerolineae bacterium]|nr:TetR/AcrR family transcriptional regulator [Anaerolineae bacterium]